MEYKLNKVDLDVRQRIEDSVRDGVVHRKDEISIKKDGGNPEGKSKNEFSKSLKKAKQQDKEDKENKKGNKILIEAVKMKVVNIEASIESKDKESLTSGRFLDTKR
ncbi:hypothetical protein JOC70_000927 [Clostridium pascui]|uniref:hypothetical protein n=1 Tax=Clostridium pascui TaxID=46609 RepID=UPI001956DB62|nr:hypothetical protein [Clostridium pascui]MBM7869458.1 hypothetical protein [Clostridium pascui]